MTSGGIADDCQQMEEQPRILFVTRNLPPLVGGMERLNWHMAEELGHEYQVRIIGPKGALALAPKSVEVSEVPLKPLWRFLVGCSFRAAIFALRWRPDLVLAGSGLTAPIAWFAAWICCARTAVYVHGLDLAVNNLVYRWLWLPFIRRMDVVIANSGPTRELALAVGVPAEKLQIVHPGAELPTRRSVAEMADFRLQNSLGSGPLLLSVGRLTQRKGMFEFVRDVLPQVAHNFPDVVLMVVGDAANDALAANNQSRASIEAVAREAGVISNLRFLGRVSDDELEQAFLAASVHVFPVRELPGDPEGFGMVAIEAAAHGVPTVAFAVGGVVDAVLDGCTGIQVAGGDVNGFVAAVNDILGNACDDAWRTACIEAAKNFGWEHFGERINAVLSIRGGYAHDDK